MSCKEVLYVLVQPRPRSTIMDDLLDEIETVAAGRRLQARRLTASAPFWGCDDTLFECKSVSKMAPTCKLSAKMANWRFFCECSNLEMIFRQMFRPNSMYWYFYSSVSNFHRRTLHGNRPKIRASDAQTNCGVLVCWSQILYDAC